MPSAVSSGWNCQSLEVSVPLSRPDTSPRSNDHSAAAMSIAPSSGAGGLAPIGAMLPPSRANNTVDTFSNCAISSHTAAAVPLSSETEASRCPKAASAAFSLAVRAPIVASRFSRPVNWLATTATMTSTSNVTTFCGSLIVKV